MSVGNPPTVSIILPAYNVEQYLGKAIESILQQTFRDFEFIIINDGSTDETEKVALSFSDARISYLRNEVNSGLVYTLNRGLVKARGRYIARMDGDDISYPDRLAQQFEYLETNRHVDVLATQVSLIDENDQDMGYWDDDILHSNSKSIRRYLAVNNCIAHPTIMGKREVLLQYKYDARQKLSEDYDLWLRMAADGRTIDKLPVPLLKHRILQSSFTRTRDVNVFFKLLIVKCRFVSEQITRGKLNTFIFVTLMFALVDAVKGTGKMLKQFFTS